MKYLLSFATLFLITLFSFAQSGPPTAFEESLLKGNKKQLRKSLYYPSYNYIVVSTNVMSPVTITNHFIVVNNPGFETNIELPKNSDVDDGRVFRILNLTTTTSLIYTTNSEPVLDLATGTTNSSYTLASNSTALVFYKAVGIVVAPQ